MTGATGPSIALTDYVWVDVAIGGVDRRNHPRRIDEVQLNGKADCYTSYQRATDYLATWVNNHTNRDGKPTVAGFDGATWTPFLPLDFDCADNPGRALGWLRQMLDRLEAEDVPLDAIRLYFSGRKGFGAEIPHTLFGGFEPGADLHSRLKRSAVELMGGIPFDGSLYDKLRLWRIPNSLNSKGRRYKIQLTLAEARGLSMREIDAMAVNPRDPASVPGLTPVPDDDWAPNDYLVDVWQRAGTQRETTRERVSAAPSNANRDRLLTAAVAASWPHGGAVVSRHTDYLLPIAGFLAARMDGDQVADLLKAAALEASDPSFAGDAHRDWQSEIDRIAVTSADKAGKGERITGLPTIAERWPELANVLATLCPNPSVDAATRANGTVPFTQDDSNLIEPAAAAPEQQPRRFRFLTALELRHRPDPAWLIEDVLQLDTLVLVVGAQETFKSFVALDMHLSVAAGVSWQGHAVRPGLTVYVSAEGGSGLGLRVQAWETARQLSADRCLFLADQAPQFLDRRLDGDIEELLLSLGDLPEQPVLIVIDTLARSMVGGDENSAEDMGLFIAAAERIRQATGATVALVHHNNKQGNARGSTALLGAVHTIIECSREANSRVVLLRCGKQKDADHFVPMVLEAHVVELGQNPTTGRDRSSLVLEPGGPRALPASLLEERRLPQITMEVLQALVGLGTASFAQWRDTAQQTKTSFTRARKELTDGGYVDHQVDGTYRPTEAGKAAAEGLKQCQLGPTGPKDVLGPVDAPEKNAFEIEGPGPNRSQTGPNGPNGPSASGVGPGGPTPLIEGWDLDPLARTLSRPPAHREQGVDSSALCAGCGEPPGDARGRLFDVSGHLLHGDCTLPIGGQRR